MSLNQAHALAFSLATSLMVTIVIFQAGDGTMGVMPAGDGELAAIVHEIDPFSPADRQGVATASGNPTGFPLPSRLLRPYRQRAVVVVEARPSDLYLTENTTMVFIGILSSIVATAPCAGFIHTGCLRASVLRGRQCRDLGLPESAPVGSGQLSSASPPPH